MGKPDAWSGGRDYSEGSKASQAAPLVFLKPHQFDFSGEQKLSTMTIAPIQEPTIPDTQTDILPRNQDLHSRCKVYTGKYHYWQISIYLGLRNNFKNAVDIRFTQPSTTSFYTTSSFTYQQIIT
jgi:hypothetical protein